MLRLTLEEAQARAIEASHRLAEGRAHESAARAAVDGRAAADRPIVAAISRIHAHESRAGIPRAFTRRGFPRAVSRRPRQLPGASRSAVAHLHRRTGRRARTSGEGGSRCRARRRGCGPRRPRTGGRAQLLGRRDRQGGRDGVGAGCRTCPGARHRRARASPRRTDSPERSGIRGGPGVAATHAAHRGSDPAGRGAPRISAASLARRRTQVVEPVAVLESAAGPSPGIDLLVTAARESRGERTALARRIDAATEATTAAAAGRNAVHLRRWLVWTCPPESQDLSTRPIAGTTHGTRASTSAGRSGTAAVSVRRSPRIRALPKRRGSGSPSSIRCWPSRSGSASSRSNRATRRSRRPTTAFARRPKRGASSTERYRAGVITQIEVLDAQFALLQAELDRTRAWPPFVLPRRV